MATTPAMDPLLRPPRHPQHFLSVVVEKFLLPFREVSNVQFLLRQIASAGVGAHLQSLPLFRLAPQIRGHFYLPGAVVLPRRFARIDESRFQLL